MSRALRRPETQNPQKETTKGSRINVLFELSGFWFSIRPQECAGARTPSVLGRLAGAQPSPGPRRLSEIRL